MSRSEIGGYVTYGEWTAWVPAAIRRHFLWRRHAYRLALFLTELAWADVRMLMRDRRTRKLAGQLYAALCAMCDALSLGFAAGPAEGRADYTRALESARISQECYSRARQILGARPVRHRLHLLERISRLLSGVAVPQAKPYLAQEEILRGIWQQRGLAADARGRDRVYDR